MAFGLCFSPPLKEIRLQIGHLLSLFRQHFFFALLLLSQHSAQQS